MPSRTNHMFGKGPKSPPKSLRYMKMLLNWPGFIGKVSSGKMGPSGFARTLSLISLRSLSPCILPTFTPRAWRKALMRLPPVSKQYHVSVSQSLLSTCSCKTWDRIVKIKRRTCTQMPGQYMASVTLVFFHWGNNYLSAMAKVMLSQPGPRSSAIFVSVYD